MGLFDRQKTNYETHAPLYTLGNSKTLLVVGLGNIGSKYAQTRHNAGFVAVDRYKTSHDFTEWIEKKDLKCYQATGQVGDTRVILVKPTTLMNNSGEAVQALQQFYKITNEDTLIIYDELDIDFGTLRTRGQGSAGGHNGIKSLLNHIKDGFGRIRIGIGPKAHPEMDSSDFVLQDFSADQEAQLPKILREVSVLIDERTAGPLSDATMKVL